MTVAMPTPVKTRRRNRVDHEGQHRDCVIFCSFCSFLFSLDFFLFAYFKLAAFFLAAVEAADPPAFFCPPRDLPASPDILEKL